MMAVLHWIGQFSSFESDNFYFRLVEMLSWLCKWLKTLLCSTLGFYLPSWHYHLLLDIMELNLLDQIIWSRFDRNTFYVSVSVQVIFIRSLA